MLPFAVQRWGSPPAEVGLYVGLVASSFFLAQSLAFPFWSWLGDRIGRRPCLIYGTLGTALSMTLFAGADSIPRAMCARALTGALSGNVAITKTYLGEITDGSNAALGFSYISFSWAAGSIFAPMVGGYFSDLEFVRSLLGDIALLRSHPYALPSLFSAAFALLAFLVALLVMPESAVWLRARAERQTAAAPAARSEDDVEMVQLVRDGGGVEGSGEGAHAQPERPGLAGDVVVDTTGGEGGGGSSQGGSGAGRVDSRGECGDVAGGDGGGLAGVLRNRVVMATIGLYALLSATQILFDELLSVFAETSIEQGGLGLRSSEIGRILLFQGISQIACQLTFVPGLISARGPLPCFRHTMWPLVPLVAFPALSRLARTPDLLWPVLAIAVAVKAVLMWVMGNGPSPRRLSIATVVGDAPSAAATLTPRCPPHPPTPPAQDD